MGLLRNSRELQFRTSMLQLVTYNQNYNQVQRHKARTILYLQKRKESWEGLFISKELIGGSWEV